MARLSAQQSAEISRQFQNEASTHSETFGAVTKNDIKGAVVAVDAYFEAAVGSMLNNFTAQMPAACAGGLSAVQRKRIILAVMDLRLTEGL